MVISSVPSKEQNCEIYLVGQFCSYFLRTTKGKFWCMILLNSRLYRSMMLSTASFLNWSVKGALNLELDILRTALA